MRTTAKDLKAVVVVINRTLQGTDPADMKYFLQRDACGSRLMRACVGGGWVNVSPILPAGQLHRWMLGFLEGVEAGMQCQAQLDRRAL